MSSNPPAARLYRSMLRLLPAYLRREYGPEMERAFLDHLSAGSGVWHRARTWIGAGFDVVRWSVKSRLSGGTHKDPRDRESGMGMARRSSIGSSLGSIGRDVRYAARVLRRQPTFAAVVIAVATLGIGANVAIFTVVNELLLEPLQVEHPETLVDIVARVPGGNSFTGFSFDDFRDIRDRAEGLTDVAAYTSVRSSLGAMEDGERVTVQISSANYFDMLGLRAPVGRLAFPEFRGFGADPVVVVSHALWIRGFGADPGLVGTTINLGSEVFTVIGVGPEGFSGTFIGFPIDLWVPLSMAATLMPGAEITSRSQKPFELLGRLRDGVTPSAVEPELGSTLAQLEDEHPIDNRGLRASVYPTTGIDHSMRTGVLAFLAVLTGVALLVLLIACLNIGSLMLARAVTRDREIAIRLAVGAGRTRVVTHFVVEAMVLIGLGTAGAIVLGRFLTDRLQAFAISKSVPIGFDLAMDHRVLGFTVVIAFLTAIGAAGAPALHAVGKSPAGALRTTGASSGGRPRLRGAFVVAQVAASVVLLIGAGLFVRALQSGLAMDVGFDADRVATVSVTLDIDRYPGAEEARAFGLAALDAAGAVNGVQRVTVASRGPIGVARTPTLVGVPGHDAPSGEEGFFIDARRVGGGYFDVVGLPLIFGRGLMAFDEGESATVVVSEAFADRFWPGQDPVGRFIDVEGEPHTVVGLASDARYLIQDQTPDPLIYLPWQWLGGRPFTIVARSEGDPAAVLLQLSERIGALDTTLRLGRTGTVANTLRQALIPQRVAVAVLGALGALGLLLTSVGVYGVVQFSVSRATQELGVRMALGGDARHVVGIVLRRGFLFMGAGAVLGTGIALLAAPALDSFLVGVSPADPATYAGVIVVLAVVGLIASGIPAAKALRIDPANALRAE